MATCLLLSLNAILHAEEYSTSHPLSPIDCSSPRGTMKSYLDSHQAMSDYLYGEHWNNPSEETVDQILIRSHLLMRLIDSSRFPPAVRKKMGVEALLHLSEVMKRIDPQNLLSAPDGSTGEGLPDHWTVPNTEITLVRIKEGEREGDYIFSANTVERATDFYEMVKDLPVYGESNSWLEKREYLTPSGWILSSRFIETFPDWLKRSYFGQGLWKILLLAIFILLWIGLLFFTLRVFSTRSSTEHQVMYLRKLGLPLVMILIGWNMNWLLFQLSFTGLFATTIGFTSSTMVFVGLAILAMPLVMLFVEMIIRSPHIASDCLDAHLLRIGGRTAGIGIAVTFLFLLSEQVGFPLYGLVAGVGVGGLAIALAARQSLENYLAGINLLSDRPVTIGDWCRYQESGNLTFGEVLSIGMRSTRIRNIDNTVTSIPNSQLANMMITNLSARDGIYLCRKTLRLRMDTSEPRLNEVLNQIRTFLADQDEVISQDPEVHLENIGPDAINIRVSFKIKAQDDRNAWLSYLNSQEDILMKMMAIVEAGGLEFAYPTTIIKNIGDVNQNTGVSAT